MLAWLGRFCWPPEPPGGLRQELVWRQVCLQCLARLWAPVLQTWLAGLPWLSLRRTFSTLVWTSGSLGTAHPCDQSKRLIAAVCAGTKRNLQASFAGEHLECSPCGGLACRERSHRLAGSGGAAVALTKRAADYTYRSVSGRPTSSGWPLLGFDAGAGDFKLTPASLQFAIP